MNVPRAAQGSLENSPFFAPHPSHFSSKKQHGVSEPQSDTEEGLCWMRRGERVRERKKKSLGKVKGALCRLAAWYRSNLSAGENATALLLHGTGSI